MCTTTVHINLTSTRGVKIEVQEVVLISTTTTGNAAITYFHQLFQELQTTARQKYQDPYYPINDGEMVLGQYSREEECHASTSTMCAGGFVTVF